MKSEVINVSVSSVEKNNPYLSGKNTIDGNKTSRWASEHSDSQWISYEFAEPKSFDFISITWEFAYGKDYEIQISDDGINWKVILKQENGEGGKESFFTGRYEAKYVRFYGIKRGTHYGYSFYELLLEKRDDGKVPAAPEKARARSIDAVIFISWAKNTETDIVGYNLYRLESPAKDGIRLNTEFIRNTAYRDEAIIKGKTYTYYITAVDLAKNESQPSERITVSFSEETKKRNYFPVPECAWKRYIGDIPCSPASSSPNRGIPLGGFGTGSFMYNLSGSFGPFQPFDSVLHSATWLDGAAFHIYEKTGGKASLTKTLSTDHALKSAWDKLLVGDGAYFALYPKGWAAYNCFEHNISQKFFSPIIPHNYKETSYPVAVWQFKLHNPAAEKSEISVMLTLPDVFIGKSLKAERFVNSVRTEGGIEGVVLRAENGIGEWCIATDKNKSVIVSYLTCWDGNGNGQDVWDDFSEDGILEDSSSDAPHTAAALSVKATLMPGEEIVIPFVISWDFPVIKFGAGTEWWKKYTGHFTKNADNSFSIAGEALRNYTDWEKQIDEWMVPVIEDPVYPDWLKCSAFNELYYTQFGGSFYEAGLKSGHVRDEIVESKSVSNKFAVLECIMYPYINTFDVRHYSSIIYVVFWPQLEKDILLDWGNAIMKYDLKEHQTPHDAGNPWKDPYVEWDNYKTNKLNWKDLHSKYIQQAWRYWYIHKDREFVAEAWDACKATYEYMKKTDTNGDCLPDNAGSDNTYDAWGLWGTSLLCGGLWVGALESFIKLAEAMGDSIGSEAEQILVKAKINLDRQLWHDKGGYYKIDTESKNPTAIMADGLNGQRYCEEWGLPDILPKERILSHLKQVYKKCVVPLHDFNGDGVGECGAINGVNEDGTMLQNGQSDEIWTGSSYFLAASMYHAGLKEEALKTAYGVYYLTYLEETSAYWFNTPEAWHNRGLFPRPSDPEQYQRPRAVWELLLEIKNPYLKKR